MAKTKRRLTIRAARKISAREILVAARTDRAVAARQPTSSTWSQLEHTLEGLLRVDFKSPFTDTKRLCPLEAWIVVNLSPDHGHCKYRQRVGQILHAVTTMCIVAEALRPWEDLFISFWTRVFLSTMMAEPHNPDEPWISEMARYSHLIGTHVCLSWADRPLDAKVLSGPLYRFLTTTIPSELSGTAVRVGVHLKGCDIFAEDLEPLYHALKIPSDALPPDQSFLCEVGALAQLSLTFQDFCTPEFNRLATILEDPQVRRIDGLDLKSSMHFEIPPSERFTAFGRVLRASLTRKPQSPTYDRGVAIAIGGNDCIYRAHIEALAHAIRGATRPIRALAITEAQYHEEAAWVQLCRFLFTPIPTATNDFTLGLDSSTRDWELGMLFSCLESLVSEALAEINRNGALVQRKVECRVLEAPPGELPFRRGDYPKPVSSYCSILEIDPRGQLLIDRPGDLPEWIRFSQVVNLRVAGRVVVGCSFTALTIDNVGEIGGIGLHFPKELVALVGAGIKRLSMRSHEQVIGNLNLVLPYCPALVDLNIDGSYRYFDRYYWAAEKRWPTIPREITPPIQVLRMASCGQTSEDLQHIPILPTLRYLCLEHNQIGPDGLKLIVERIRSNPHLEFVDLRHRDIEETKFRLRSDGYDATLLRSRAVEAKLEQLLRSEHFPLRARAAFLSVLPHVETDLSLSQCVPTTAVALVFQYASRKKPRTVFL